MAFSKIQEIEKLIEKAGLEKATADDVKNVQQWAAKTLSIAPEKVFSAPHVLHIAMHTAATILGVDSIPVVEDNGNMYWTVVASQFKSIGGDEAGESSSPELKKLKQTLIQEACNMVYAAIRPERYDLFNHMSASEMFFIDGDSLLLHVLSNYHVNWELVQSIHVVYLALQLLEHLSSRGGKFQVIFFESNEFIWTHAPQKRLLREVLRLALKQRAGEVKAPFEVTEFENWWDEEFLAHIENFEPEFILLNDGEQILSDPMLLIEGDITRAAAINKQDAVTLLHAQAVTTLSIKVHVAYTSRLTFKDNGIVAFVARSFSTRFQQCEVFARYVPGVVKALIKKAATPELEELSEEEEAKADSILEEDDLVQGARDAAILLGLQLYLAEERSPQNISFAKALVATTVAMRGLEVRTRAQPRGNCAALTTFLSQVSPYIARAVVHFVPNLDFDATIVDVIDGNLLFTTLLFLQEGSTFEDLFGENDLGEEANAAWAFLYPKEKALDDGELVIPDLEQPEEVAEPVEVNQTPNHPLLTHLTSAFRCEEPVEGVEHKGHGMAPNLQRKQWHMKVSLEDMDRPPKDDDEAAEESGQIKWKLTKRQKQKMGTRYLNSIMETAQSMEGVAFLFAQEAQCIVDDRKDKKVEKNKGMSEHAKKQLEKNAKKGVFSSAEIKKRENTIRLANKAMTTAYKTLRDNLDKRAAEDTLTQFMNKLNLAKGRSGEDAPTDAKDDDKDEEESDEEEEIETAAPGQKLSPIRLAFQAFVGPKEESDVVFQKDKKGKFCGLEAISAWVDAQEKLHKSKKETILDDFSYETKSRLQLMLINTFENHLKFQVLLRKMEIAEKPWKEEKERAANDKALLASKNWTAEQEKEKAILTKKAQPKMEPAVKLFRAAHACYTLLERTHIRILDGQRNIVRAALRNLDFQDSYYRLVDNANEKFEDPSGKLLVKVGNLPKELFPAKKLLNHTASRFQMNNMGHLMDRHVCPGKDSRVPFNPDDWQRELLDVVDRRGSAVVCAPTSAGKTFISYYCMKKVLRESNDDVVVYIAPTRALVNQAVADVYCRFGGKAYREGGKTVFGVLGGRDFVRTPFNCQVLVTLPEAFEAILMSPIHQKWAQRIKYIIFDEIHSIDNFGNGAVWERLLMMVRAPFVALSATLGETTELCEWLNRVQERQEAQWKRDSKEGDEPDQDYSVAMIPSGGGKIQRWSDIQKYAFLPNKQGYQLKTDGPKGPYGLDRDPHLNDVVPVHPLSCVTLEMLRTKFPPDLQLVPKEAVQLFDLMNTLTQNIRREYASLAPVKALDEKMFAYEPDVFFAGDRQITQRRSREYEALLRATLMEWGKMTTVRYWRSVEGLDKATRTKVRRDFEAMVKNLLAGASHAVEQGEKNITEQVETDPENNFYPDTFEFVKHNMLPALHQLKANNLLPALVFNFEQDQCDTLATHLVEVLEEAEARYRQTEAFAKYKAEMEAKRELQQMLIKTREGQLKAKSLQKGENGKVEEVQKDHIEVDETASYEIPDVLPEFSFASNIAVLDSAKLDEIDEQLRKLPFLRRAIQRGIGIHHAGIKGKLRNYVEKLFRMKHLPVVFATEGLALGVHSPCRTVVLGGDHILLNTMQFRQMAGRAGRRGMDFLGHAVFLGVSFRKIRRLLTSDLMVLKGHVQLDPITQLRLLQIHDYAPEEKKTASEQVDNAKIAKDIAECLMTEPLFKQGRVVANVTEEEDEEEGAERYTYESFQLYHYRRMLAAFYQQGLHFKEGPSALGNMSSRALNTYNAVNTQNAAIVFNYLLSSMSLHTLETPKELQDVLSYIFSRDNVLNLPLEIHPSAKHNPATVGVNANRFGTTSAASPTAPSPTSASAGGDKRSKTHSVMLPSLESAYPAVHTELEKMNGMVMAFLTQLAVDLGTTLEELVGVDRQLPIPFLFKDDKGKEKRHVVFPKSNSKGFPLAKKLKGNAISYTARSPFVALAGVGDVFDSVEDLQHSVRSNIFFDSAHIPAMDFVDLHSHHHGKFLINAAVKDFDTFESDQIEGRGYRRIRMEQFNGLTPSMSYDVLSKFGFVTKNLTAAFRELRPQAVELPEPAEGEEAVEMTEEQRAQAEAAAAFHDTVMSHVEALEKRWSGELEDQLKNRKSS